MKLGDLVGFGDRTGIIVEDCTMLCSYGVDEPYIMGAMVVYIEGRLRRVVYKNLRLLNESR
jgi:hypothetical protein